MPDQPPRPPLSPERIAEIRATLDEVWTLLNELGMGRGTTLASLQRRLRVGTGDAMRLFALREATMSLANAALAGSRADTEGQ